MRKLSESVIGIGSKPAWFKIGLVVGLAAVEVQSTAYALQGNYQMWLIGIGLLGMTMTLASYSGKLHSIDKLTQSVTAFRLREQPGYLTPQNCDMELCILARYLTEEEGLKVIGEVDGNRLTDCGSFKNVTPGKLAVVYVPAVGWNGPSGLAAGLGYSDGFHVVSTECLMQASEPGLILYT